MPDFLGLGLTWLDALFGFARGIDHQDTKEELMIGGLFGFGCMEIGFELGSFLLIFRGLQSKIGFVGSKSMFLESACLR